MNDRRSRQSIQLAERENVAGENPLFAQRMTAEPWVRGGSPPWHMCGNSIQLRIDSAGLDPDRPAAIIQQLNKIEYKRPETWSFWFGARLIGATPIPSAAFIKLVFDVYHGTGRSVFQTGPQPVPVDPFNTLGFATFLWSLNLNAVPDLAPKKYTSQVDSPLLDDRDATSIRRIEWIPAQDIQVNVRMIVLPILLPTPFVYEAEAYGAWAPRSHVRPDWFTDGSDEFAFRGDETGGK